MQIDVQSDGARARVVPRGELDMATAPRLRGVVETAAQSHREVVLDLVALEFIDSTGLKALLDLDAASRADGFRLRLAIGPTVRHLLALTGLEEHFDLVEP